MFRENTCDVTKWWNQKKSLDNNNDFISNKITGSTEPALITLKLFIIFTYFYIQWAQR